MTCVIVFGSFWIYLGLYFFKGSSLGSAGMFDLGEAYPEAYPRSIPRSIPSKIGALSGIDQEGK